MISEESWDPPPFAISVRNPDVRREWAERVAGWCRANPEVSAAWDEALLEGDRRANERKGKESREAALRFAGAPSRLVEAWSTGLEPSKAVEAVRAFLASEKVFLLLLGSPGCGKTAATAEALLGPGGQFCRAVALSRLSSYDKDDRRAWEHACETRVLVLDDLGAELLHDAWRPMLDELIDIRWGNRLQTLITSNLDKDAFKARYGERIADRIRDDGFVETCGDKSRRGRK